MKNIEAALIELGITLETLKTNEPIHRAEGKIEQADLCLSKIEEIGNALDVLNWWVATTTNFFKADAESEKFPVWSNGTWGGLAHPGIPN